MKIAGLFLFGAIALTTSVVADDSIQVIEGGEGYKFSTISLKDLSRIHCSSAITNVFYSKEKEIEIKTTGNDAYIKVLPRKTTGGEGGEKIEYGTNPRELYIECAGETFSLVLVPKDLPAQTIVLKTAFADVKRAVSYERSNSYDAMVLDLVKKAYVGDVPDGYEPTHIGKTIKEFSELDLIEVRSYVGAKYTVSEYLINAKKRLPALNEAMFIPYLKGSLAISIVKTILEPTESTKMFVVSLNQEDGTNAR